MSDLANKITSQILLKEPAWLAEFKKFIMRGKHRPGRPGDRRRLHGHRDLRGAGPDQPDRRHPAGRDRFLEPVHAVRERRPSLEATRKAVPRCWRSAFLNAVIVIVGFAVFWLVKLINKLHRTEEAPKPKEPTPTEVLLMEIRDG